MAAAATGARGSRDPIYRRFRSVRGGERLGKLPPSSMAVAVGAGCEAEGEGRRVVLSRVGAGRGSETERGEGAFALDGHVARARVGAGERRKTMAKAGEVRFASAR